MVWLGLVGSGWVLLGLIGSDWVWLGLVGSDWVWLVYLGPIWIWVSFPTFSDVFEKKRYEKFDTDVANEQFVNFYSFKLKIKFLLQKKWNEVHRVCVITRS